MIMKEFEISLEVTTVVKVKTQAFNRNDAKDTAYHLLAHELIKASKPSVQLTKADVGKILSVKEVKPD